MLGDEKVKRLQQAHVLVVGVGGVGAYAAEMLCRAGVGRLTLVDADDVHPTNINRQLPAMHSTIGKKKVEVLAERCKDINPDVQLTILPQFLKDENIPALLDASYESVSAIATVGLSRGFTGSLNAWGKLIVIVTMYLGRVGPISLAVALGSQNESQNVISEPEEDISIG